MGFKKGRERKSEVDRRKRRKKSTTKVHSYALTSVRMEDPYAVIPPTEGIEFPPLFSLSQVFPPVHLTGIFEKFKSEDDYGKFAPFRDRTFCELVTDEKNWMDHEDSEGLKFSELSEDEKMHQIHKAAQTLILMIRLRGMSQFIVPLVIHGSSFSGLKNCADSSITVDFDANQSLIFPLPTPQEPYFLDTEDIDWILRYHQNVMRMNEARGLEFLFDLFSILNFPSPSVQVVQIWGAIEAIVKPKRYHKRRTGIRHSLRSRCAMILEDEENRQKNRYDSIGELYDFRSEIVHGIRSFSVVDAAEDPESVELMFKSFTLLKELMISLIEAESMPSKQKLENLQIEYERIHPVDE
jgi:hypothetical protein